MPASLASAPPAVPAPAAGRLAVAPAAARFLARCGLATADDIMTLSGEVVCGHPDRHVVRVVLTDGIESRAAYLKREHTRGVRARLKNWRAGAGWVSRCDREAAVLVALADRGLPGPRPLAWGEDAAGRAFLLVAELTGAADLRRHLAWATPDERRTAAVGVGRALADLHAGGVSTPDLAAKHVFVAAQSGAVTLIDWQGATLAADPLPLAACVRALATLDASVRPELASIRDRVRLLRAYLRRRGEAGSVAAVARRVRAAAGRRGRRASVRDQRAGDSIRLVWLAGEAACAVPAAVPHWPTPADGRPFYPGPAAGHGPAAEQVTLPGGVAGTVVRFRTTDPVGRAVAAVRERPWRSPGAEAGRVLAHLHRHGVPAPTLLGFGQKLTGPATADSFVFFGSPPAAPVAVALSRGAGRRELLASCGELLRRVHDAGLRVRVAPTGCGVFAVGPDGAARLASPLSARRSKRVTPADRRTDLRLLFRSDLAAVSRTDRLRVARAAEPRGSQGV